MKFKKIVNALLLIILFLSIVCFFFPPKQWIMKHNQQKDYKITRVVDKIDNSNQKDATLENVIEASKIDPNAIGKLVIPQEGVGISLPILQGIGYYNMLIGAGEQLSRSEVAPGGKGNYILASHHTPWADILFTNLSNVQVNSNIYVADEQYVYVYQVNTVVLTTIDHNEYLDQPTDPETKMITLYTCEEYGSPNRWVVQGKLIAKKSINNLDKDTKVAFADWLSALGKN